MVALLVVQALFAMLHVAGKIVLAELSPLALAGTRVAIATPLLLLYAWRHDRTIPARSDWPRLALLGLLGILANQTLFLLGTDVQGRDLWSRLMYGTRISLTIGLLGVALSQIGRAHV